MDWVVVERGKASRDRHAHRPVPEALAGLRKEEQALLRRWLGKEAALRGRATLLRDADKLAISIEQAERLCERLLEEGFVVFREKRVRGAWQWESLIWRDLPRSQALLGVSGKSQRADQRQSLLDEAGQWLERRREDAQSSALDPDLLDELTQTLERLQGSGPARPEVLGSRLALWRAVADWHDAGLQGSRQNFALRARESTKSLTKTEWRWLEAEFDLERLRIAPFVQVVWLAGDIELRWQDRCVHLGPLHCVGLPQADLARAEVVSRPVRWWLIENRASFERQAAERGAGVLLAWMPGRPSTGWLAAMGRLLAQAPAPAWISADADPSGVDIACAVGAFWQARGQPWQPHRMGLAELRSTDQYWPLNEHDRRLLATLLARPELPPGLRALCEVMQEEGRKAEQEAWI